MRGHCAQRFALVLADGLATVEVLDLEIRIDGDQDVGHVSVNLIASVAQSHVVQQSGFVQIHQCT